MIRLFDRSFLGTLNIVVVLTNLFGINVAKALRACAYVGINRKHTLNSISKGSLYRLERLINNFFLVERPLRREYLSNIDQKIKKGSYQGLRLKQGLPCRGQRTHTNAKTAKRKKSIK